VPDYLFERRFLDDRIEYNVVHCEGGMTFDQSTPRVTDPQGVSWHWVGTLRHNRHAAMVIWRELGG
jgi:hypothetical protein